MAPLDFSSVIAALGLERKPPTVKHELKWKIPETRMCAPIADAEKMVATLRKNSTFINGGQYIDTIYARDYGQGIMAYFLVRTDKNTEKETLVFDGYMVQEEEEKLGMNIEVSFELMKNLASMGYKQEVVREVMEWNFSHFGLPTSVFDVTAFGEFLQVSVPATKFEADRRLAEKKADRFFEHLKIAKRDIIPTDVVTLQVMLARQQAAAQKGPAQIGTKYPLGGGGKSTGGNSLF